MGFRFRRSVRLMPGIRLNFSKSGTSLSVGRRGATMNFSKRGTRTTVGIPGTGLSWSETAEAAPSTAGSAGQHFNAFPIVILLAIVGMLAVVGMAGR